MPNHEIQIRNCQKWVVPPLFDDKNIEEGDTYVVQLMKLIKKTGDNLLSIISSIKSHLRSNIEELTFIVVPLVSSYTRIRYIKNHLKVYSCTV